MRIKKLTAAFGCLDNETLELHGGLNVVYAPNESGKSTWCAFIRAMLYGIDSSQREKNGIKPDKIKFAPWSGASPSGEMELEEDGREITLARKTRLASAPMREFSAVYTGTAQPVAGLTGSGVGAQLTGMSREVFESSVFVRQSGLSVANSAELEKRIASIVSTGDEDSSFTDADERLRAWLRKRRYNRSGKLPELESEIDAQKKRIDALGDAVKEQERLSESLLCAEARCETLRKAVLADDERLKKSKLQYIADSRGENQRAERESAEAALREAALRAELESGIFGAAPPEAVSASVEKDLNEYARRKKAAIPIYVPAIVLALAAIVCLIGLQTDISALVIAGGVLFLPAVVLAALYRLRYTAYEGYGKMFDGKYGSRDPEAIRKALDGHCRKYAEWQSAADAAALAAKRAEGIRAQLAETDRSIVEDSPDEPARRHAAELREAEAAAAELRQQLAVYEGRFGALGDPMVLKTEKEGMEEQRAELQEQYDALALAVATLREANDEMQARFSPRLSRRASELMSALTGGRYDRLVFDRELSAMARRTGDTADHELSFLSSGTADQLYLALRLAICELALPEGRSCPLILDDALVNFDDERMAAALELLLDISKSRQVILFTCHDREEKYLEKKTLV